MKRLPTSMWLSPHTKAVLAAASEKLGMPKTAVYEMALRDFAAKHKVRVEAAEAATNPTPEKDCS